MLYLFGRGMVVETTNTIFSIPCISLSVRVYSLLGAINSSASRCIVNGGAKNQSKHFNIPAFSSSNWNGLQLGTLICLSVSGCSRWKVSITDISFRRKKGFTWCQGNLYDADGGDNETNWSLVMEKKAHLRKNCTHHSHNVTIFCHQCKVLVQ